VPTARCEPSASVSAGLFLITRIAYRTAAKNIEL